MRGLALLLALGCHQDPCDPLQTCGSAGQYRFCHAAGTTCEYQTNDGATFACRGCSDCSDAKQLLDGWCNLPSPNPTNSSNSESCQSATCPFGAGTYQLCSTSGATHCRYLGSDGSSFACSSCSDCASAADAITQWCSQQSPVDCNSCLDDAESGDCAFDLSECSDVSDCLDYETCLGSCSDSGCADACASDATILGKSLGDGLSSCLCSACGSGCVLRCP